METIESLNQMKVKKETLIFLWILVGLLVALTIIFMIYFLKVKETIDLDYSMLNICALITFFLAGLIFLFWMQLHINKQIILCNIELQEKEKIREKEEKYEEKNQTYRLEALKWEKLHKIILDFAQKNEVTKTIKGKTEKIITLSFDPKVLEIIKALKIIDVSI